MVIKKGGNLPVLYAQGKSIPEAWENSVVELYNKGLWWHREGPKDKGRINLDSTMTIEITNPDSDLIMHKYMTGGPEELFDYQMEILGAKDSWVHPEKGSTKWPYHYHERFASYPGTKELIDQIERVIDGLSNEPWKRRHNMITWVPEKDFDSQDPPCLQRIWLGIIPDDYSTNESFKLNMNYHFRSRNVMIAAPMNMIGLWTLQTHIKNKVIEGTGMNLENGRLVDIIDSYHVSAQDMHLLKEKFLPMLNNSKFNGERQEERCFDKKTCFGYMNKEEIVSKIIEQTKKEFKEKGLSNKGLENEIKKIQNIANEVSKINGY